VIGGTILQNRVKASLPAEVVSELPPDTSITYALIPVIHTLPPIVQDAVRSAFAEGLKTLWRVMLGVSGFGLLSVLVMKEERMRRDMDERWALQEEKNRGRTRREGQA
jgi:hypothetical protein